MKSYTEGMVTVGLNGTEKTREWIASGRIVVESAESTSGLMGETNPAAHSILVSELTGVGYKAVVAFLAKDFSTMGMRFAYVVNHSTREVVQVFKKGGKFIQKDIKALIAEGFTEFVTPNRAPKNFRLPNDEIVKVTRSIDMSPAKTTRFALSYAGIL